MLQRRRAQASSASRAGRLLRRFRSDPGPASGLAVSGVTSAEPLRRTLGSTRPQPPLCAGVRMGGGWHLPYGGTLAGLSDPGEGSSDGELWDCSFAACTLFSHTLCVYAGASLRARVP